MLDIFSCFLLSRSPPKGPKPREGGLPFFFEFGDLGSFNNVGFDCQPSQAKFQCICYPSK